jgi:hypothetical protein
MAQRALTESTSTHVSVFRATQASIARQTSMSALPILAQMVAFVLIKLMDLSASAHAAIMMHVA